MKCSTLSGTMLDVFVLVAIIGLMVVAALRFGRGVSKGLSNSNLPSTDKHDDGFRNWYLLQQTTNLASSLEPAPQPSASPSTDVPTDTGSSQPDTSSTGSYDSEGTSFDSSGAGGTAGTDGGGGFGGGGGDAF